MVDTASPKKESTSVVDAGSAKACPRCNSSQRTRRIPRPLWMRIFPHSMNMLCGHCNHRFWYIS